MTENTVPLPPAGWFPDPEVPGQMRWWDGVQWQASRAPQRRPLGKDFGRLGRALVILLGLHGAFYLVTFGLYTWGVSPLADAYDGATWIQSPGIFDVIELSAGVLSWISLLACIVVWCLWQFQLAQSTLRGSVRRSPGMHVGSWFIPIVFWWFPYQNMKDLWQVYVSRVNLSPLGWWWTLWLVANFFSNGFGRFLWRSDDDDLSFHAYNVLGLIESAMWLVCTALAIRIVQRLTRRALAREGEDATALPA